MGTLQRNDTSTSLPMNLEKPYQPCVDQWNSFTSEPLLRSPKDSPPIEKKRFKRFPPLGWLQQRSDDSEDGETSPRGILKRVTRMSSEEKRVQFNDDTYVQHIDEQGKKITGTESLCLEPKDRKAFMSRNLLRISQTNYEKNVLPGYHQIYTYPNPSSGDQSQVTHEVHVYFIPDKQFGTRLKMLVKVGTHFVPDEICVKANMSGNKIRVMANKVVESGLLEGAVKSEPFNERFLLPVAVDPYSVEARLDNKGNLTIEAPLMSHTRKSDIAKEQTESRNKSL